MCMPPEIDEITATEVTEKHGTRPARVHGAPASGGHVLESEQDALDESPSKFGKRNVPRRGANAATSEKI